MGPTDTLSKAAKETQPQHHKALGHDDRNAQLSANASGRNI